ncbi:MAG: adenosylmethionine decarboxylase [Cytophagales bacterium]|nr:adenosylmethionine decarboxylase [Armatimonadota bacterium]
MGIDTLPRLPFPPEGEGKKGIGIHLLLDFYGIAPERLTDADLLSRALLASARAAKMTPLSAPVLHRFPGGGLTGFLPLAESHIAFHSYPEIGYLAADVFTCGADPEGPDRAVAILRDALRPGRESVRRFARGDALREGDSG